MPLYSALVSGAISIRQFYAINQTTFVADFIERFESLMNHLISYSESTHPYFFLTRFVKGLRPDIRAVVLVQRPPDLDTTCSLALLQEEVADGELPYGRFSHANRGQGQASRTASISFFVRPATPTATLKIGAALTPPALRLKPVRWPPSAPEGARRDSALNAANDGARTTCAHLRCRCILWMNYSPCSAWTMQRQNCRQIRRFLRRKFVHHFPSG